MYKKIFFTAFTLAVLFGCSSNKPEISAKKIRVGIFNVNGGSPECITDAFESVRIDKDMQPEIISAATIYSSQLNNYDVIIMPGGSGTSETLSLGEEGIEKLRNWVLQDGKCIVGICAGAYILSQTPNYNCFSLSGYSASDIEHDHRGNGLAKFTLTEKGKEFFPELSNYDTLLCQYYEGPVLVPVNAEGITEVATMQSDVHLIEGTPANMTNNKPFVLFGEKGKGKTVSFVGHPETTPGMRWMVPRMIRVALGMTLIEYPKSVVRPEIWNNEILFDQDMRNMQDVHYTSVKYGSEADKLAAIDWLVSNASWSAQKWMPGLLRSKSEKVRARAAQANAALESTDHIADFDSAIENETSDSVKTILLENREVLKSMLGK